MAKQNKKSKRTEQTLAIKTPAVKQTVVFNSETYVVTKVSDKEIEYKHIKSSKEFFSKR